jgi:hypothetical protein
VNLNFDSAFPEAGGSGLCTTAIGRKTHAFRFSVGEEPCSSCKGAGIPTSCRSSNVAQVSRLYVIEQIRRPARFLVVRWSIATRGKIVPATVIIYLPVNLKVAQSVTFVCRQALVGTLHACRSWWSGAQFLVGIVSVSSKEVYKIDPTKEFPKIFKRLDRHARPINAQRQ